MSVMLKNAEMTFCSLNVTFFLNVHIYFDFRAWAIAKKKKNCNFWPFNLIGAEEVVPL